MSGLSGMLAKIGPMAYPALRVEDLANAWAYVEAHRQVHAYDLMSRGSGWDARALKRRKKDDLAKAQTARRLRRETTRDMRLDCARAGQGASGYAASCVRSFLRAGESAEPLDVSLLGPPVF